MNNVRQIWDGAMATPPIQQVADSPQPPILPDIEPLFTPEAIARYEQMASGYLDARMQHRINRIPLKQQFDSLGINPTRWRKILILEDVPTTPLLIDHLNAAIDQYNYLKEMWRLGYTDDKQYPDIHGIRWFTGGGWHPRYIYAHLTDKARLLVASRCFADIDRFKKVRATNITKVGITCE